MNLNVNDACECEEITLQMYVSESESELCTVNEL